MLFFDNMIFLHEICIEDRHIEVIYKWLKPLSVKDIWAFFGFANFY